MKSQLNKAEQDDLDNEKEIEVLKRKALRETEEKTWEAISEVGALYAIARDDCD